jgi:predicted 3-demethylubiquinone-9 3-methyltransferase (glyoxalase superfamily)
MSAVGRLRVWLKSANTVYFFGIRPLVFLGSGRCLSRIRPAASKLEREYAMQKISPFLWFDDQAEEAANYYVSIFKNSAILGVSRYGEGAPRPAGTAMSVSFVLDGVEFQALNGGPEFAFTEAISFFVAAETQDEIDELWEKLTSGGEPGQCGWLKDRYGLSWQIVPPVLGELLGDPDPQKASRVMQAMFEMTKIDIAALQAAHHGG